MSPQIEEFLSVRLIEQFLFVNVFFVWNIPELQHCQPFPDDKRDLLAFSISSNSFIMSLRNVFLVFSSTSKMEDTGLDPLILSTEVFHPLPFPA